MKRYSISLVENSRTFRPLFSTGPAPVSARMLVIFKVCIEHGVFDSSPSWHQICLCRVAKTEVCSVAFAAFLFRSRVEKKFAHLARHTAGDGSLLRPCNCLIQIGGFQYPESAHVLLGLGVRPVGDEHPAVGLLPQRLRVGGRGNAAGELPDSEFMTAEYPTIRFRNGFGTGKALTAPPNLLLKAEPIRGGSVSSNR